MPNPIPTDPLNVMITRLEEANARAYAQSARTNEKPPKSEQDAASHSSDQQSPFAAPNRRSSRAKPLVLVLIGLVLTASVCTMVFAWEPSYRDGAKLVLARWAAAWGLQTGPQGGVSPAPLTSPKTEQQLQRLTDDIANVEQRIEQLEASQDRIIRGDAEVAEQFKSSREQMSRDATKVAEQLNAVLAEIAGRDATIVEQLKATQEQLAEVAGAAPGNSARKPLRLKPISKRERRRSDR